MVMPASEKSSDFAFVGFAGLELELHELRAVARWRARLFLDAEVLVNGERQLLGHLFALVRR